MRSSSSPRSGSSDRGAAQVGHQVQVPAEGAPQGQARREEGQAWALSFHGFTSAVKVTFLKGMSLRPAPPGASRHKDVRYLDLREGELVEAQMATWGQQAALPGGLP